MIAIDTSAIVAIVEQEEECDIFANIIARHETLVGAPTLLEAHLVLNKKLESSADVTAFFDGFLALHNIRPVAFSLNMFQIAQAAFERFGKNRPKRERLNFGDCLSYAVAKHYDVPLLYKGNDFPNTDIEPAFRP